VNVSCPECRSIFRVDPAKLPPTMVRARCSVCGGVITISAGSSIEDEFSNSAPASSAARPVEREDAMAAQRANAALAAALLDTSAPPRVPKGPTPAPSAMPPIIPEAPRALSTAAPVAERSPNTKPPMASPAPAQSAAQPAGGRPILFPPRPMMPGAAPGGGPAARPIVAPRTSGPLEAPAAQPPSTPSPRQSAPNLAMPQATNAAPTAAPAPAAPRPAVPAGNAPTASRTPINPFLANDPHAKAKRLARALVSDLVTYFPQKRQEGLRDGTLKQLFKDEIQKSYEEYVVQVGREFAETTPHFQDALNDLLAGGQRVF